MWAARLWGQCEVGRRVTLVSRVVSGVLPECGLSQDLKEVRSSTKQMSREERSRQREWQRAKALRACILKK